VRLLLTLWAKAPYPENAKVSRGSHDHNVKRRGGRVKCRQPAIERDRRRQAKSHRSGVTGKNNNSFLVGGEGVKPSPGRDQLRASRKGFTGIDKDVRAATHQQH